jgi:hypothetical protein
LDPAFPRDEVSGIDVPWALLSRLVRSVIVVVPRVCGQQGKGVSFMILTPAAVNTSSKTVCRSATGTDPAHRRHRPPSEQETPGHG